MKYRYSKFILLMLAGIVCQGCKKETSPLLQNRWMLVSEDSEIMSPGSLYQRAVTRYFYDEKFRLIQSFVFHGNEKMAETGGYWYNPGKKAVYYERTNYLRFGSDEKLTYKILVQYNEAGMPARHETTDEDGFISLYLYEYDEHNRKMKEKYYRDGIFIYEMCKYVYDNYGNPVSYIRKNTESTSNPTQSGETGLINYTLTYTYDSFNRISSYKKYTGDYLTEERRNYRYDENGNPVYYEIYNTEGECEQKITRTWQKCAVDPAVIFYHNLP